MREFAVNSRRLLELEAIGLVAIELGNRVWYSRRQLEQLLGKLGSPDGGAPVKATKPRRFEFKPELPLVA